MRLRILDRYIFQEVIFAFLFAICAFTAVFIGSGTLFRIAKYITEYNNVDVPDVDAPCDTPDVRAALKFQRNYRDEVLRNKFQQNRRARNFFGRYRHDLRDFI